jgi:DNA-binding transcriptional LysR family regulator
MKYLSEVAIFVRVAECGSFSAAAELLLLSRPAVSQAVSRLEQHLGARLLHRSTRKLSLTEAGAQMLEGARAGIDRIAAAELQISASQLKPTGRLRITTPVALGVMHVAPLLGEFGRRYPDVEVVLRMSDDIEDIVARGFDVAVRVSDPADSSLVSRRLARVKHYAFATPQYLAKHGTPATPQELVAHRCLVHARTKAAGQWRFVAADGAAMTVVPPKHVQADNSLALREAVLAGAGISVGPDYLIAHDIQDGRLVRLLPGFALHEFAAYAQYPVRKHVASSVQLFVNFIAQEFKDARRWPIAE